MTGLPAKLTIEQVDIRTWSVYAIRSGAGYGEFAGRVEAATIFTSVNRLVLQIKMGVTKKLVNP